MKRVEAIRTDKQVPDFLDAKAAADYLKMPIGSLPNIRPYMHFLELPHREGKPGNYRYPVPYLIPLRTALRTHDRRGYIGPAEDFSRSPGARSALLSAELNLDFDIQEAGEEANDGLISGAKIGTMIDIGRTTLNRWRDKDVAEVIPDKFGHLQMSVDGLKQALTWHRPDAYNPLLRPLSDPLFEDELQLRPYNPAN